MGRHEVELSEEDSDWLKAHWRAIGAPSLNAYLRDLVISARKVVEETPPEPENKKRLTKKQLFLHYVSLHPELATACQKAGVTLDQVESWKTPAAPAGREPTKSAVDQAEKFCRDLEFAQFIFLGKLQEALFDMARGRIKGNPNAAGWILNALHPAYGRVKAELILRVLDPLTKAYGIILLDELGGGEDAKAAIDRADKRFEAVKMARLTDFT